MKVVKMRVITCGSGVTIHRSFENGRLASNLGESHAEMT
jgi:hypothetical protein